MMGYPNPTQQQINFVLEPGGKETVDFEYSYALIDKNGATVKNGATHKNALVVDVSDLKRIPTSLKCDCPTSVLNNGLLWSEINFESVSKNPIVENFASFLN